MSSQIGRLAFPAVSALGITIGQVVLLFIHVMKWQLGHRFRWEKQEKRERLKKDILIEMHGATIELNFYSSTSKQSLICEARF